MDFLDYGVYANMEIIFLVSLRMIGFIMSAPFFSGQYINTYIKVGLSFILANIVVATGIVKDVTYTGGMIGYGVIGIKEVAIGLMMGYIITVIFNVIIIVGDLIDFQIGLTMASVMDPLSGIQMPITGNFYFFLLIAITLITNAHHQFIKALVYSYEVLELGMFNMTQALFNAHLEILTDMFVTAIKLASPVVGIMLLMNVALGILGRTAPQMNLHNVGMPIKIYLSLYVIVFITPPLLMSYSIMFDKINISLIKILKGMIP